ncbi:MAG TPA: CoA ester lyase [Jiangellaceae bacterium]
MTVVVTLLYAPADRPDVVGKALDGGADVVVVDLEDAVAPVAKDRARAGLPALLADRRGRAVQVRVNALGTAWAEPDLAMVARLPGEVGVRVPKVTSPADVAAVVAVVGPRRVHVLIETAAGVEAAGEIARAPGVATVGLGEADLRSDLGVSDDDGLAWSRQRLVVAARAAGLPPPAMAVYPNVTDLAGLASSTGLGRRLGFVGRAAIHPRQLAVIEAAFTPTTAEVEQAEEVVTAVAGAQEAGAGVVVLQDGSFLDVAMVERARRVLDLAARDTTAGTPSGRGDVTADIVGGPAQG